MAAAQTGHPDAEPTGRPDAAPTKEPTVNAALPVPPSEQPNAASKTSEKTGENTSNAHRQPSPLRVAPLDGAAAELKVKTERRPTAAGGGPCARLARASRELAALTCRTQYIPLYISFFTFQAGALCTFYRYLQTDIYLFKNFFENSFIEKYKNSKCHTNIIVTVDDSVLWILNREIFILSICIYYLYSTFLARIINCERLSFTKTCLNIFKS